MTSRGIVKDGVVVLASPEAFPEGATVEVVLLGQGAQEDWVTEDILEFMRKTEEPIDPNAPTLYDEMKDILGTATGLPPDLAAQHDHYRHGHPKR